MGHRFVRRGAAEAVTELAGAFGKISCPHLLQEIGEARLKNASSNRLKRHGESKISGCPGLLLGPRVGEQSLGLFSGEANPSVGSHDF